MSTTSTRFFTVILPTTIQEKKLRIPKSFIIRFGQELSAVATLQVRNNSDIWKIKLVKIGEDLYFKDGFHRFLQHHSIEESFFLVFKYLGNSAFDVVIFDPYNIQVHFGEEIERDADADTEEVDDDDEDDPCCSIRKHEKNTREGESGNPSLTVTLKSYNVRPGCYLNLPQQFSKECTERCPKFMIIQNAEDGSEFLVRCYGFGWQKITKGWANFVRLNDLHEGDVSVFEFMQGTPSLVQVTISRANQGAR